MSFSMRTNGKLLLTGEYFVTEGAVSLALPTQLGQTLDVQLIDPKGAHQLHWKSYSNEGEIWFEAIFDLPSFNLVEINGDEDKQEVADNLQNILRQAKTLNADFLQKQGTWEAKSVLEFSRDWGLGSSSTLITMLAEWANVDPFLLLEDTFGGSGYDIAAAKANGPLLFQKFNGKNRWDKSGFNPSFKENLYFVHLGKKQSSKEALVYYTVTAPEEREVPLPRISQITHDIAQYTDNLADFETLLEEHENLVQGIIQQPRAKELYFSDYWGEIKSLGGWGGDFVLATSNKDEEATKAYFQEKGFETILKYKELIKEY
ncbi:GYDIA family GHMP kinase [Aureispira anguillae]|uniref:GYDIA family GHMP kinase n=1 Tax=Aureispira anguillae TaxID=2864201 RepID=A0A915YK82_9BACT|nr:GYDIA family GHMP kinase [Aureispira anguillae]BDS14539.1 GYDIA family GHMP kinase [Aureispira anguillae]